jgi:hypothetical protein
VSVALTGLQTILAALHQRELDAVIEADNGLTFGADVAAGLLCAAASCGALVAEVTNGRHQSATVFMPGSKAEGLMTAAVQEATKAARQPDKPPRNRVTGQSAGGA